MTDNSVSPFLFVGIFIFVIPTLLNIFNIHSFVWIGKIGLFILIGGILHTAYLRIKNQ